MSQKQLIAWVLVVGALNWGFIGLLGTNLVEAVLGAGTILSKAVYIVIGLAGGYKAYILASGGGKK